MVRYMKSEIFLGGPCIIVVALCNSHPCSVQLTFCVNQHILTEKCEFLRIEFCILPCASYRGLFPLMNSICGSYG
ncbi:hypothetical protein VNO80_25006 [Phaseolus coccineus]|uniref:Uncharacterized protein n=1 Tax=Phaseolus coccineus TaxID=3886 RepID=A0AAN9QSX0_PHACN